MSPVAVLSSRTEMESIARIESDRIAQRTEHEKVSELQEFHGHEVVALVLGSSLGDEHWQASDEVWYQLRNTAEVGSRTFKVEWEDVYAALHDYGSKHGAMGQSIARSIDKALVEGSLVVQVWHSHYLSSEPSAVDISSLPTWLTRGMVYHAPTSTTTSYDGTGILNRLRSDSRAAIEDGGHGQSA